MADGLLIEGLSTKKLLRKLNKNSKNLSLWSIFHIFIVITITLLVLCYQDQLLYAKNSIGKLNDCLILASLYVAHLLIIIESQHRKSYFIKIWENYSKLQKLNRKLHNDNSWLKHYLIKFLIYWIFTISMEIFVRININGVDEQWERFWYITITGLFMTRMRHLQQLFFVDLVLDMLRSINQHLKNCTLWATALNQNNKSTYDFIYKSVKCKKDQFKLLVEIIICINRIFCWSQLAIFGQNFLEVTSELYWVYAFMTREPVFLSGEYSV